MSVPITDDARWLALCASKGQESPDPRTKIGCLIVAPDGSIRCAACNDYPHGVLQGIGERAEAPRPRRLRRQNGGAPTFASKLKERCIEGNQRSFAFLRICQQVAIANPFRRGLLRERFR